MAGMFYSLQEVAKKLNVTEEQVSTLVRQGRLREFRDGLNLLFKVDEVEALLSDTTISKPPSEADEIQLQPEEDEIRKAREPSQPPEEDEYKLVEESASDTSSEEEAFLDEMTAQSGNEPADEEKLSEDTAAVTDKFISEDDMSGATTAAPGGAADDLLAETAAEAEEASLAKIEEDVSLDSFGSGSGLLDLSLQADDTSLGGILDEIYTPEDKGKKAAGASAMEPSPVAAESIAEEIAEPQFQPSLQATGYIEPEPDAASNILGRMLFLPIIAVIYTAIVVTAGTAGFVPTILKSIRSFIWYIMIGFVVVALVTTVFSFTAGRGPKVAKPKVKKEKAPKAEKEPKLEKEKKEKKPKREKKKKEEEKR